MSMSIVASIAYEGLLGEVGVGVGVVGRSQPPLKGEKEGKREGGVGVRKKG